MLIGMDHFALPDDPMAVAQRNGTLHRNFQGYSLHGDADLLGMGVSAISAFDDFYAQNLKVLSNWQEAVQAGRMPIERGFLLDWDDRLRRDVIMGLLCDLRLDLVAFRQRWEVDFADYFKDQLAALGEFEKLGLIDMNGPVLKVTDTGRLVVRALVMLFDRYAGTPNPQRFSRII